jgi:hypothetical protein
MPKREARTPTSAKGDWFIDDGRIDCAASREVAPGLIVERGGKSVFARRPMRRSYPRDIDKYNSRAQNAGAFRLAVLRPRDVVEKALSDWMSPYTCLRKCIESRSSRPY